MTICTWYEARLPTRGSQRDRARRAGGLPASRGPRGTLGACTIEASDVACAYACITSHHPPVAVPNRARTMPPLRAESSLGVPGPDSDGRRADEHLAARCYHGQRQAGDGSVVGGCRAAEVPLTALIRHKLLRNPDALHPEVAGRQAHVDPSRFGPQDVRRRRRPLHHHGRS